jgi:hypothetical protein
MSESIHEADKHGPPLHPPPVTILMNNTHTVKLPDKRTTGLEIKEAAIAQGVPIQLGFVLFRLTAGHKQHPVRDDDKSTVHDGEEFRCVDNDDNS